MKYTFKMRRNYYCIRCDIYYVISYSHHLSHVLGARHLKYKKYNFIFIERQWYYYIASKVEKIQIYETFFTKVWHFG